jgi:hypothetical protein
MALPLTTKELGAYMRRIGPENSREEVVRATVELTLWLEKNKKEVLADCCALKLLAGTPPLSGWLNRVVGMECYNNNIPLLTSLFDCGWRGEKRTMQYIFDVMLRSPPGRIFIYKYRSHFAGLRMFELDGPYIDQSYDISLMLSLGRLGCRLGASFASDDVEVLLDKCSLENLLPLCLLMEKSWTDPYRKAVLYHKIMMQIKRLMRDCAAWETSSLAHLYEFSKIYPISLCLLLRVVLNLSPDIPAKWRTVEKWIPVSSFQMSVNKEREVIEQAMTKLSNEQFLHLMLPLSNGIRFRITEELLRFKFDDTDAVLINRAAAIAVIGVRCLSSIAGAAMGTLCMGRPLKAIKSAFPAVPRLQALPIDILHLLSYFLAGVECALLVQAHRWLHSPGT